MSGRGPGGLDIDGLMQAYEEGRSLIQPGDRLAGRALRAGLIDDVEAFDARFFGISPVEARHMDPRQRILLEECWRCLEDANVLPRDLTGARVGCYVGVTGSDFTTLSERAGTAPHPYALSGTAASIVANRISSFFDWRGPSMAIDTACSSGLTALVRALSDLAAGLCEQAFVASANLVLDERLDAALEAGGFLSKSGRCSAFRDEADGYVRADGVFGIFLKPLSRARADGDRVRAVIRAAEDGHGGRAASLTAPSAESQAVLLARAWRDGIGRAIGYVETHGTGTRLGDPIEIDGLKGAMASVAPERSDAVYLGALKANAGHAEASAGLAGLAKVVRILETGRIPPNRAPGAPNPFIDVTAGPFRFPDRAIAFPAGAFSDEAETGSSQETPRNQGPRERRDCRANVKCSGTQEAGRPRRVAGVSSFGFGGSNVHVVLEAWPEEEDGRAGAEARRARPSLVVLSARSAGSLRRQAARLADALESEPAASLAAVARTLALHRTHFEYRAAFLAPNREALSRWLRSAFEIAEPGRPVTGAALHPGSPAGLHAASSGDDPAPALRAFLAGEAVDFGPLFHSRADPDGPRPQRLPGYAFDRDQVFPLPRPSSRRTANPAVPSSGEPARDEAPYVLTGGEDRRVEIRLGSARRLFSRHRVNGSGVLPGVAGLLLAEDAFRRVRPSSPSRLALCDVGWPLAIGADDAEAPIVVEIGETDRGSTFAVSICGEERLFGAVAEPSTRVPRIAPDFANWQRRQWALDRAAPSEAEALYRRFADQGIDYDGEFRCLRHVERSGMRCRAVLERRNPDWNGLVGLLDGALQSGLALSADGMGGALMPFSLGALIWHRPAHTIEAGTFHAMTLRSSRFRTQIQLCDSRLEPVAAFVDLGVRPKPAGPATSETTHLETAS